MRAEIQTEPSQAIGERTMPLQGAVSIIKTLSYQYRDSHDKDKTVLSL